MDQKWNCSACTFANLAVSTECEACQTTRKTVPFVVGGAGVWRCKYCDTDGNPAGAKACSACLLVRRSWTCRSCQRENPDDVPKCPSVGCLSTRPSTTSLPAHSPVWQCPMCSFENSANNKTCGLCTFARPSDASLSSWKCAYCSYENTSLSAHVCEVCSLPREREDKQTSANYGPTDSSTKDVWTCPACTFANRISLKVCESCEGPKPETPTAQWTCPSCRFAGNLHSGARCTSCGCGKPWTCSSCRRPQPPPSSTNEAGAHKCFHCGCHPCVECGRALAPQEAYLELERGKRMHQSCLVCVGCSQRILSGQDYVVDQSEHSRFHPACHDALFTVQCRVCDKAITGSKRAASKPLSYLTDTFWDDAYCISHEHEDGKNFRCLGCLRMWPRSRARDEMLHLSQRHHICPLCAADEVVLGPSAKDLAHIQQRILSFFSLLGLELSQKEIIVRVVDPAMLTDKEHKKKSGTTTHLLGRCEMEFSHVMVDGHRLSTLAIVKEIRICNGLPLEVFEDVLCHELMHAHLGLKGFPELEPTVEEGLCQLLSFLWLKEADDEAAERKDSSVHRKKVRALRLQLLERGTDPVYAEGFRLCYTSFLRMGCLAPLLEYVFKYGSLPPLD